MKKLVRLLTSIIIIIFLLSITESAYGTVKIWYKIGNYQSWFTDAGVYSGGLGWRRSGYFYFDGFTNANFQMRGWHLGVKDWTDENGNYVPFKTSGAGAASFDEQKNTMPIPDEEGITFRRYLRQEPPTITVDGYILSEPFPRTEDEVDAEYISGSAYQMLESWFRTGMGLLVHQRLLGWAQKNHDDYVIYEWTFINNGNNDLDDDVELPDQTLDSLYFLRGGISFFPGGDNSMWNSAYGERPGDTLRLIYAYDAIGKYADFDDFGDVDPVTGFIRRPQWIGEAVLHCDSSPTNHLDDLSQPQMTGVENSEIYCIRHEWGHCGDECHALVYEVMQYGFHYYDGTPYMTGTYPGTHHGLRMDEQGIKYPEDFPWWNWSPTSYYACGPFTMGPGDTIRVVFATVMGSITPRTAWDVGTAWKNGSCIWGGPDNLPPPWQDHPDLAPTDNDKAKDSWVSTGKDSLFKNVSAAQWNVRQNYEVPTPPPAPSIEVSSLPDKILIEWGNESESATDFAGYRVYRAIGNPGPIVLEGQLIGEWERIFECGEGTANPLTNSYDDTEAERGKAYYYYVTAFDDGLENEPDFNGVSESLESGKFLNMTTRAAYLTRPPGDELSDIRIVPNPDNVGASDIQYPGEPDKIMFLNLPAACDIMIYSESGDLITTLEHRDGSGDEAWVTPEGSQFLTSSTGQIVVSGLYIAHVVELDFETNVPTGNISNFTFLIVR